MVSTIHTAYHVSLTAASVNAGGPTGLTIITKSYWEVSDLYMILIKHLILPV